MDNATPLSLWWYIPIVALSLLRSSAILRISLRVSPYDNERGRLMKLKLYLKSLNFSPKSHET